MLYQKQHSLFDQQTSGYNSEPGITYINEFLPEHACWYEKLTASITWNCEYKSRKTALFGVSYHHGADKNSKEKRIRQLPRIFAPICQSISTAFRYQPNNCLVNYYPDGNHYISFHSDQDTEMQNKTGVTIISLGAVRNMTLKSINNPSIKHHYPLQPGSAFFMPDSMQSEWQHGILKQAGAGPRISLSFRALLV